MFTTKNLFMLLGRHLLIAGGFVLVAVITVVFISSKINGIVNTVTKNRQLASTLERRTELFATLKSDVDLVGANDVLIEKAFPPTNDIVGFSSALENLALKNGVTQSFHFSTPVSSTVEAPFPLFVISYSNNLSGNIITFISYLKEFERLPYFTKMESLNITSGGKWTEGANMSFNATIQTKSPQ